MLDVFPFNVRDDDVFEGNKRNRTCYVVDWRQKRSRCTAKAEGIQDDPSEC